VDEEGELLLNDAQADGLRVLDRHSIFQSKCGLVSHPAVVADGVFVRETSAIRALSLLRGRPHGIQLIR